MLGTWAVLAITTLRASGIPDGQPVGNLMHVGDVLASNQRERGDADLGVPAPNVGHEQLLLHLVPRRRLKLQRTSLHFPDEAPHARFNLVRAAVRPIDPHAQIGFHGSVQIAPGDGGVLLLAVSPDGVRPGVAGQPRSDEYEPLDQVGPGQRHLEGDASPERDTDQGSGAQLQPIKQLDDIASVRVVLCWERRLAEPSQIASDRSVDLWKRPPLRLPHATVTDTFVDQENGRTLACHLMPELHACSVHVKGPR